MRSKILVIDDEDSMCNFLEIMLKKEGYEVETASDGFLAVELLKDDNFDLVISDMNMPGMTGLEVLQEVKTFKVEQDFIVMTAFATVDTAIEAMKLGASDYITKPFKVDEIKLTIEKSINRKKLVSENIELKKQLQDNNSFSNFIGNSEPVVKLKKLATRVASSDSTVLVLGESGTGKDLISKAIHHLSPRCNAPFITINCGAIPENLLESELFGHIKGAFTGAIKDKDGLFKVADRGTIFLDEIGNTSLAIQVKLLRVLEDKIITPVGDTKPIEVDVRLIAATNAQLEEDVRQGRFREDLFYRLNVIPIEIPSLRERKEDIPLLVDFFIKKFADKTGTQIKTISKEASDVLFSYNWPGNVRELENTLERAVLLNRTNLLELSDFPEKLSIKESPAIVTEADPLNPTLESMEKAYIHFVMSQTGGKNEKQQKYSESTLPHYIEKLNGTL